MERIEPSEFARLLRNCRLLEKDGFGPKVLLCDDAMIVKILRRKRFFSRAMFSPPGRRFAKASDHLKQRGIATVTVVRYGHCPDPARDLVWYRYLPGKTLRWHSQRQETDLRDLMHRLGTFVALLHQRGILFRSIHWDNILVKPDGEFALIDILDLSVRQSPLNLSQRRRNMRHLLRYEKDVLTFRRNAEDFWTGYESVARLTDSEKRTLRQLKIAPKKK